MNLPLVSAIQWHASGGLGYSFRVDAADVAASRALPPARHGPPPLVLGLASGPRTRRCSRCASGAGAPSYAPRNEHPRPPPLGSNASNKLSKGGSGLSGI